MSHILVCAVPNPGHVGPMLAVAQHLKSVGHEVTFNTSENFRGKVESTGIQFVAMAGKANYDYRQAYELQKDTALSDAEQKVSMLRTRFAEVIPDQHRVIQRILRDTPADLVVIDTMFMGALPMLLGPRQKRPPVICCGVNPVMLGSRDCGIIAPPADTADGKQQILEEKEWMDLTYQPVGDYIDAIMRPYGVPPMPHFFIDCNYLLPEVFLQFTAEEFEYPRADLPDTVRYIGAILPPRSVDFEEPDWWTELEDSKPVVLITQGTLANRDFQELIQPALDGLAGEKVTVIVAAGRSDTETLVVPENARVAAFIPFDRILPKVDVFVTNGGYGAVTQAFSMGVPIVAAGSTEDKDMVGARVGWSGAGINLKTRNASPAQIQKAVRTILGDKQYREKAQQLAANFSRYNALDELARTVDAMLKERRNMAGSQLEPEYAR